MPDAHDDVIDLDPTAFTRRQLLAAVRGDDPRLHPVMAVRMLAKKRYATRTKNDDLVALLDGDDISPRVRTAAAVELGRLGTDEARNALAERSTQRKKSVREPAAAGLRELTRLHEVRADQLPRQVRADVSLARALAADAGTEPPVLYVDEERAAPITTRKATARTMAGVAEGTREEAERLGLDPSAGREVRCAGQNLVVLTPDELVRAVDELTPGEPGIAAAVASRDTQETGEWDLRYFVAITPDDDGLDLRIGTRGGRVAFVGRAQHSGDGIDFSVHSVASPGSAPAVVEGRFDSDGLRFERALSSPTVAARMVPGRRPAHG